MKFEYIVVGSGAGGGTVAARLAEYGHRVLLLEAGGDPRKLKGSDPGTPNENCLPADYDVPAFHALASENEAMSWDFYVRHYANDELQQQDPKYREHVNGKRVDGVLYPRAGTLGGCTAHNAMITVYPHNRDWEQIQKITGDPTWSPDSMRTYFERLENCRHRPIMRFLAKFGYNPSRHGFKGWLSTQVAIPAAALDDGKLKHVLRKTIKAQVQTGTAPVRERIRWFLVGRGDPNDWRLVKKNSVGVRFLPIATRRHARNGTRERVLAVMKKYPDRLVLETDALVTRVLLDENKRAYGVEYLKGANLYRASKKDGAGAGEPRTAEASREVILAGGAFNTPQLLMLSGIGPADHLQDPDIDVPVKVPLAGVGENLQDRYEIGVVNRMNFKEWRILRGAQFNSKDRQYKQWKWTRTGVYKTNGVVSAVFLKSPYPDDPEKLPDIFCFALLGPFAGYEPDYSARFAKERNYLTWAVLKAHTNNCKGTVRLRSKDPRDTPAINFCYFDEGNDATGDDLKSTVWAVEEVRKLTRKLIDDKTMVEELPGNLDVEEYVKTHAWGHHACGTCKIGPEENGGVVNGDFEVHGTRGLRIVDASVFPKIPGFFIVSSIYTIAEKAADVIHAAAKRAAAVPP